MKKYFAGILIFASVVLLFILLRWVYLQDKQREQLEYQVCLEMGCSESQCKLFAHYAGQINLPCPNGHVSKSE